MLGDQRFQPFVLGASEFERSRFGLKRNSDPVPLRHPSWDTAVCVIPE